MRLALLAAIVLGGGALAYAATTFLYLTPPNPLKAGLLTGIYAIEHPLFAQNWHLFAPNPVRHNMVMAVRCRTDQIVTNWHDPYTGWLAAHHRNRLSPMGKAVRVPQNAMHIFSGKTADDWRPLICARFPGHAVCSPDHPSLRRQREIGALVIGRLASAACRSLVRGPAHGVQIRILVHKPPPWSGRHLPSAAGETTYITLPWMAYRGWE